jgi:hypothetical protein
MMIFISTLVCALILQTTLANFTVSGVNSGGFMAVQMHVAFSSDVTGAAIIAGGPFDCAQESTETAKTACTKSPALLNTSRLISYTDEQAAIGQIDPTINLQNSKVWIFSGELDSVVKPGVAKALVSYYENYMSKDNIATQFSIKSQHSWVTENYGNACDKLASPYMNNCGYDSAGALLQQLYGTLNPKGTQLSENLRLFDQKLYDYSEAMMLSEGYIYVPSSCQDQLSACNASRSTDV